MDRISQSLDLTQTQTLVMTPQLQQAIKMLQLSNIELDALVDQELENNPLIEKIEKPTPQEGENASFDAGTAHMGSGGNIRFETGDDGFESRLRHEQSLREHLMSQLTIACSDPRDLAIGSLLIDRIDGSGYITETPNTLAKQLACKPERVMRLITVIQTFDPTGVGAKNLSECLALQLREKNTLDDPMQILLNNLDVLAKKDFKVLADMCGVNATYLHDMIEEIQSLNPKPAAQFDHFVSQTVVPDALMHKKPKHEGGGWRVVLNNYTLPKVLVNQSYVADIKQSATQKADKTYITSKLNAANWLIRAMDQRAHTILKVASEIVEEQSAFFDYGIEFLKPMKLRDIAEKIDMHESTVSRVTTGKYMGTPRGLIEMKFFFSTGLENDDGLAHSAQSIKARIKSLIDEEDPKKILSDDKLVALLKAENINVARRTVAKYREAMRIGSSVERRREKKVS